MMQLSIFRTLPAKMAIQIMEIIYRSFRLCLCMFMGIVTTLPSTATSVDIQSQQLAETSRNITVEELYRNESAMETLPAIMKLTLGKQEENRSDYCKAMVKYLAASIEPLKRGALEEAQPFLEAACVVAAKIPQGNRTELAWIISKLQNDTVELRYNLDPEQQDYLIQYLLKMLKEMPGNTVVDRASLIEARASVLMSSGHPEEAQLLLTNLMRELKHSFPGSPKISSCLKLLTMACKLNGKQTQAFKWQNMARTLERNHPLEANTPNLESYNNRSRSQLAPFSQWNGLNCDPEFPDYNVSKCSMEYTSQCLDYLRPLHGEALKAYNLNTLKIARESGNVNAIIAALLHLRTGKLNADCFTQEEHIAFSQELENIRAKQNCPYKLTWSKLNTADDYAIAGQYKKAIEKWKEAVILSKTLPKEGSRANDRLLSRFTDLCYAFIANGKLQDARTIFHEAFRLALNPPTSFKRATVFCYIDLLCQKYQDANDYNSCEAIHLDALNVAHEHGSAGKVAARDIQLRLANLFAKMKQPEKAAFAINDFMLEEEGTIDIGKKALIAGLTEHAKVLRENGYAKQASKILALAMKKQPRGRRTTEETDAVTSSKSHPPKQTNQQQRFALPGNTAAH